MDHKVHRRLREEGNVHLIIQQRANVYNFHLFINLLWLPLLDLL